MKKSDKQFLFLKYIVEYLYYAIKTYPDLKITFGDGSRPFILQYIYYYGFYVNRKTNQIEQSDKKKITHTLDSDHLHRMAHDFNYYWKDEYLDPEKESAWPKVAKDCMNDLRKYWKGLHPKNVHGGDWVLYHNDKGEPVRDWPHKGMKQ